MINSYQVRSHYGRVRQAFRCLAFGCLGLFMAFTGGDVYGQLRVVSWNTSTTGGSSFTARQSSFNRALSYLGEENVNGIAKDVDLLILQEQAVNGMTLQQFANELNTVTGSSNYSVWSQNPYNADGMQTGFVYNSATVQVVFEDWCQTDATRSTSRICLRPVGYDEDADLWVYNTHYKAGTSSSDQVRRRDAAIANRWQTTNGRVGSGSGTDSGVVWGSDFLAAGANVIYAGDFNQRSSSEDANHSYSTMVENPYEIYKYGAAPFSSSPPTTGNGQAVDPVGQAGTWHDSSLYRSIHTQNPAGSGFVGGGMDDRFDFQMISTDLTDGEGMSYIGPGIGDCAASTHSYRALGNNGTHSMNQAISTGTGAPSDVLLALATASDHLPVVADYQLPAKMSVQLGATPGRVLVGANVSQLVTVSNSAPAIVAMGADELDYQLSSGQGLSGSSAGTVAALAPGNSHALSWNTSSAGCREGTITVTSTSQAVADGSFNATPSMDVLDHANPSFHLTENVDFLEIDFGIVAPGSLPTTLPVMLWNLEEAAGYTASMDLDSISGYEDTDKLFIDLAPFTNLQAGGGLSFQATFDGVTSGLYVSGYVLSFSDEDLPGESTGMSLTLALRAAVAAPGDASLDGVVNEDDAAILSDNWEKSGFDWSGGDFNGDGRVDAIDASILAANWGNHLLSQEGSKNVPEPGSLAMMIALAATIFSLRASNKKHGL